MTTGPTRRTLLAGGCVAVVAAAGIGWGVTARDRFGGAVMDPAAVHRAATSGEVLLLDIRRPEEWDRTGVPEGGRPLDMRRDDFVAAVDALTGGDRTTPVALICAGGVRSDRTGARLAEAGFTNVIDVSEGMLGSAAGPGWLARGLPVVRP